MPNTQSDFEMMTSRPKGGGGGLTWRLLVFSSLVFLVMAASYIGLEYGYKTILINQKAQADSQAQELIAGVPAEQQRAVIDFYSRLANMRAVLANHIYMTQFLRLLEEGTSKGVYFSGLKISADEGSADVSGVARNYEELATQLKAFAGMTGAGGVNLKSAITTEGGAVVFEIEFNFDRRELERKR